tara:strand:- start:42 stop:566 length:525 start_codon:yes stop_codon:yes gene_type:complete
MEEIIIKKESVFKTKIQEDLIQVALKFIDENKNKFESRSWDCNIKTSTNLYANILYQAQEFKNVRKNIEEKIEQAIKNSDGVDKPFSIYESWVNVYEKGGYQEFHMHEKCSSGVLYLSSNNSAIEFAIFPEDTRKKIEPQKADLLFFKGDTYHRVLDSKDGNRVSLAFNFSIHG